METSNTKLLFPKPISIPNSTQMSLISNCSASSSSTSSPPPPPQSLSSPPQSLSSPPTPTPVVLSPCAACKILRRRCVDKCILAPYFPPTELHKFTITHRVFGASNIIKFLQELPEWQRADAVSSMVYEANGRVRDPVYGCAGTIFHLQKQLSELQAELAKTQAKLVNMQSHQDSLQLALICAVNNNESSNSQLDQDVDVDDLITGNYLQQHHQSLVDTTTCFSDDDLSHLTYDIWASPF